MSFENIVPFLSKKQHHEVKNTQPILLTINPDDVRTRRNKLAELARKIQPIKKVA